MSLVRLSDLPVLRVALEYLDPRSLCRLGLTNKEYHTLSEIVADYILRHLGYFVTHGCTDNERPDQSSFINLLHRLTAKRIILIGGGSMEEGEASYKRADHLDIASGEWKSCSSMTKKRGTFKTEAVAVGNFAVAVSGDDESAVGTLEAYSPLSDTWIDLPTLPEQLMLVAAAAINQTLYISGGINKTTGQYSNVIYCLEMSSPVFGEWSMLPVGLLKSRVGHASAALNGKLWVAGGQFSGTNAIADSPDYVNSTSVEYYDPITKRWNLGPSMLAERIWFRLLVINNALYAVGGDVDTTGRSLIPTIERLNIVLNRWEKIGEFRDVRRVFSTSAVDNKIYVFGGRDVNYGTLQDWDCFDCKSHEWESVAYDQLSDDDKKRIDSRRSSRESIDECMASCDSMDSLLSLMARSPETRQIPRAKFYGGQAITLPAEEITW